jgi:hypothetical protein
MTKTIKIILTVLSNTIKIVSMDTEACDVAA